MNPTVWWIAAIAVLGLVGVAQMIWPRWFAWFQQLGMYRETPEPSAFLLASIRIAGVAIVLGCCAAIAMITGIESRVESSRLAEATRAAETAELQQETQDIKETLDICSRSFAVLEPAVGLDADSNIVNVAELESLAAKEGVSLRPWAEDPQKTLIVSFGGTSMYALPSPGDVDPCAELSQRLLLSR